MKRVVIECDICGAENAKTYTMPVYRTFDGCDGKTFYKQPHLCKKTVYLCDKCALKSSNVHEIGVMEEKYCIDVLNPEENFIKKE